MKTLKYLGLFLVLGLTITSCSSGEDSKDEAKLKEAGELHDAALALGEETMARIEEASDLVRQVVEAMPAMEEMDKADAESHLNSITEVKEDYEVWQKSLVEVPGHAHEHHEGHHHNHDHSMDDASADEVLKKQEELKDFIADVHNRATKAVEALQSMLDRM